MEGNHDSAGKRSTSREVSGYQRVLSLLVSSSFTLSLFLRSCLNLSRSELENNQEEWGRQDSYPPYFNTVISGIAAPNGKLLFISFHLHSKFHQITCKVDLGRGCKSDEDGNDKDEWGGGERKMEERHTFRPERRIRLFPFLRQ